MQPGQRLDSESRLAERFGISVSTVREALSALVRDGINTWTHHLLILLSNSKLNTEFLRLPVLDKIPLPLVEAINSAHVLRMTSHK